MAIKDKIINWFFNKSISMLQEWFPRTNLKSLSFTNADGLMFSITETSEPLERAINNMCEELKDDIYAQILSDNGCATDGITEIFLTEARVSFHFKDDGDNDSIIETDISERVED